jgi:hypothetical protein
MLRDSRLDEDTNPCRAGAVQQRSLEHDVHS